MGFLIAHEFFSSYDSIFTWVFNTGKTLNSINLVMKSIS